MPDLPHGWRMRNSSGEIRGPPVEEDGFLSGDDDDDGINLVGGLDIRPDSEGWDDVEEDAEALSIVCLLCDASHSSAGAMVKHCKDAHNFDFTHIQQQHKLDFYGTIKLVNYIRSQHKAGQTPPAVDDPTMWADDKYLQPTLEEDAFLFTLDDVVEAPMPTEEVAKHSAFETTPDTNEDKSTAIATVPASVGANSDTGAD